MHACNGTRRALTGLIVFCLASAAPFARAAEAAPANVTLIGTCVACHGADGIGKAPQYPNLAGQSGAYLEKQLLAYRSGERQDSSMNPLAAALSDADIAVLAAFFAGLDRTGSRAGQTP